MCGFSNPVSFKKITDLEISLVENFIRTKTLGFLTQNLCNSINENCDVLVDDDTLNQHFGTLFSQNTSSFQFQAGVILLIKELVEHVQLKVDRHGNSYYKNPEKKIIATQNRNFNAIMGIDESQLKNELEREVIGCSRQHVPDLDPDLIDVKLLVKDGKNIYGVYVYCIICNIENRKKQNLKRVFFNTNGKNKGVWVLSNFKKHLQTAHCTIAQSESTKNVKPPRKHNNLQMKQTQNPITSQSKPIDIIELGCSIEISDVGFDEHGNEDKENASLVLVNDEDFEREQNKKYDNPDDLFTQLSSQVTKVHGAVLTNTETQQSINFILNKSP